MDEKEFCWLAGLLEGEGSFQKPPPSDMKRPRIYLETTDEDVIRKVNALVNLNYYMTDANDDNPNWKPSFRTLIRGQKAITLMRQIYPLMGERRKNQIAIALNEKPSNQLTLTDENWFFWLAGLLEGEGAFQKSTPSKQNQPRIQLHMTDLEIVSRAASLTNAKVHGPYYPRDANSHLKARFFVFLYGKRAVELMQDLHPHMSMRRQAQIDAVINSYHPVGHLQGEKHPQAKLDSIKVKIIKQRLAQGEKLTALAQEFAVDKGLIWQIKKERIWQHVK